MNVIYTSKKRLTLTEVWLSEGLGVVQESAASVCTKAQCKSDEYKLDGSVQYHLIYGRVCAVFCRVHTTSQIQTKWVQCDTGWQSI